MKAVIPGIRLPMRISIMKRPCRTTSVGWWEGAPQTVSEAKCDGYRVGMGNQGRLLGGRIKEEEQRRRKKKMTKEEGKSLGNLPPFA